MQTVKNNYVESYRRFEEERDDLDKKIEKRYEDIARAERSIERLNKKKSELDYPNWVESLVKPIAEKFAEDFGLSYNIYGPFGIRSYVTIYWMEDKEVSIVEQPVKLLTLEPFDLEKEQLYYETGRKRENISYPLNSIGAMNGMDREILPLPDSFDEIRKLIRSSSE
ncbi:hypothetical protein MXL46_11550 [Heyndrickxia sporothermodurans]|uniref:hypothetical protein n=1 Tax=Heyndrickxia sporothermodurans TaxID=46224 RepID=UPI002DB87B38|nr:hypothetical protein [Heyndrickxia sporothermodurans]MEB6549722.1 hypothetical protein [Heyndrickxia sporothermodurans]